MKIAGFRSPRTAVELRANTAIDADSDMLNFGVVVRSKRRAKALVTAWDDKPKSASRCWKDYRRTQHK